MGEELAFKRRLSAHSGKEPAKGATRLATAADSDRSLDGADVRSDGNRASEPLNVLTGTPPACDQVRNGSRTGVGGAGSNQAWRYWIEGDPTVSPYRAHSPSRRAT